MSLMLLGLFSCGPSRNKEADKIKSIENRLFSPKATSMDKEAADSLLTLYSAFIKNFPSDSLTRKYTFKPAAYT